jgi:MOSC domain-containing protein YiiM
MHEVATSCERDSPTVRAHDRTRHDCIARKSVTDNEPMTVPDRARHGDATVVSVHVGRPRTVQTRRAAVTTAIWKDPVEGRVAVRGVNLDGDDQADRSVHGGPDKAVYAYALEEVRAWENELGRDLGEAAFGQNLTTQGIDVSGALIGERWLIASTLFEVAQPRLPCFKLGLRIGTPAFVKRFAQAARPGAYLRIVKEGDVGPGDPIEVVSRPDHGVTSRMVSDAILRDPALIPAVVQAEQLPAELRSWLAERIRD